MQFLIIVGARGLGRLILSQARGDGAHNHSWTVYGFLDTKGNKILPPDCDVPVVGDPLTYQPHRNEIFLPAIGDPEAKKKIIAPLIEKGANFIDLRTAVRMGERTIWGRGTVFGLYVDIGPDSNIGSYVYMERQVLVGHDVQIGDYSHIGAGAFIGGNVKIGECVTIQPKATIAKGVIIGDGAEVGIGSVVLRDVEPGTTVLGNPARILR